MTRPGSPRPRCETGWCWVDRRRNRRFATGPGDQRRFARGSRHRADRSPLWGIRDGAGITFPDGSRIGHLADFFTWLATNGGAQRKARRHVQHPAPDRDMGKLGAHQARSRTGPAMSDPKPDLPRHYGDRSPAAVEMFGRAFAEAEARRAASLPFLDPNIRRQRIAEAEAGAEAERRTEWPDARRALRDRHADLAAALAELRRCQEPATRGSAVLERARDVRTAAETRPRPGDRSRCRDIAPGDRSG